jgi:hypothetical protein
LTITRPVSGWSALAIQSASCVRGLEISAGSSGSSSHEHARRSRADGVELLLPHAALQHVNRRPFGKIVGRRRNRRQRRRQRLLQSIKLLLHLDPFLPGRQPRDLLDRVHLGLDPLGLRLPRLLVRGRSQRNIVFLGRREVGLQPVVILLRDRLQLVVVAAGAADRHPQECSADDVGPLGQHLVAGQGDLRIAGVAADRPQPVEDAGGEQLVVVRTKLVAGNLLTHELVVRLVGIERANHIIAEPPRIRHVPVVLVAFGLGIADDVEPVLPLPLAEAGAGDQPIGKPLVGIGRFIFVKRGLILRRRRQSSQIE